jgi:TPR repeat protein
MLGASPYNARFVQLHTSYVFSRRHFRVLKKAAEKLFQEGNYFYRMHRYREAAEKWRWAAQMQHGPSHASLSTLLFYGGMGVDIDVKQAIEVACAGAALGCQDSKGALADCLILDNGIPEDVVRGLALAKESAATGSSFGMFAYGWYFFIGNGVDRDNAETVRLWRLAAAQGHRKAASMLSEVFGIDI